VAAGEEAHDLLAKARGDSTALEELVERRLTGEPLAWIIGHAPFDGFDIRIHSGLYVPRGQSAELVHRAVARLPQRGTAIDLCTGSGALAVAMQRARPGARIVGTDIDDRAVTCARANGVIAYRGDLFDSLPLGLEGSVDVVVAVVPYVPTAALHLLPRDTLTFECASFYDGGPDGAEYLRRVAAEAPRFLRPGGALLLEVGADQPEILRSRLELLGYTECVAWSDEDGDVRGLEATLR
jgi:release factor glutamine methyltransferase